MKKHLILIVLALALALALSACGCKHETWHDATCVTPKTCADCGETEGEALGHVWAAATCETPKTCETCGETNGEAKGHDWKEATCEAPKTCANCNLTEGEALGHDWQEATTDAPKTCATCAATEGEKITTDSRFTTASTKEIQGAWIVKIPIPEEMVGVKDLGVTLEMGVVIEFKNDGTLKMYAVLIDEEAFLSALTDYTIEATYKEMEAEGYSREEADALIEQAYGMSLEKYVTATIKSLDLTSLLGAANYTGVYFVEDGTIYTGLDWEAVMEENTYTIEDGKLILDADITGGLTDDSETTVLEPYTQE